MNTGGTAPGWYPDPTMNDTRRYWDGESWTEHVTPTGGSRGRLSQPTSPYGLIVVGFLLTVLGGAVLFSNQPDRFGNDNGGVMIIGWIVASLGTIATVIGTVAAGVRLGMELTDYDRQQRGRS